VRVAGLLPPALLAAVVGLHLAVRARRPPGRAGLARDGAVLAGRWLAATAAAVALGIAAWPYLQADPLHRLAEVLRYNSDFPHPVPLWFGGRSLPPGGAGWRYLPVWLAIGLPVGLQAGALLGCARAALGRRAERPRPEAVAALLLAAFFPILYAMARQSTLYNGLRHFLFVLPPLAALAGWGWHGAIVALRRAPARWALVAVLALALLEPLVWMVRAHPLGYVYFSPLGGGIARLGTRYEADYWRMHLGPLCRKLDETLERMPGRRPLILGIQRSQHLRLRLAPLLREPARLVLVEPDDPRAQLVAVLGGPCASRPELERCYFVLRAVADQRPFLVVEKRPSFDEPPAAPQRRRRRRPAAG
jgi:hypothetical protein